MGKRTEFIADPAMRVRHHESVRLMERGSIEGWEALTLIAWPPPVLEQAPAPRLGEHGGQRTWSDEAKGEVLVLLDRGLSKPQISERTGVPPGTIRSWLRERDRERERQEAAA